MQLLLGRVSGLHGLIAACAVLSACGEVRRAEEPRPEPAFASGERLRARVRDAGDGAVIFDAWYDGELDAPCAFLEAKDGRLRCLPWDDEPRAHFTSTDILYTGADCTGPVRIFPRDQTSIPERVVGDPSVDTCRGTATSFPVFELGEEVHPASQLHYLYQGECRLDGSAPSTLRVFSLGDEVDPSAFVGAEEVIRPMKGERLAARNLVAEDGAWMTVALHDQELATECAAGPYGWPPGPCVPRRIAWGIGQFADDQCSQPIAYVSAFAPGGSGPECADPEIVIELPRTSSCDGPSFRLHDVGAPVDSAYRNGDGTCGAALGVEGHANFLIGDELPMSTFASVDVMKLGTGRIQASYSAVGDHPLLATGDFYDLEADAACYETTFCDGTVRCSAASPRDRYYPDANCKTPIIDVPTPRCGEAKPPRWVQMTPEDGSKPCGVGDGQLFELGSEVPAPTQLFTNDNGCVPAGFEPSADSTWYGLGRAIDPSVFPVIEKRIE